jgi:hypothetical protein
MKRSRLLKIFKNWLKENRSRFIATPYISKIRHNYFEVRFNECPSIIYFRMRNFEFDGYAHFRGRNPKSSNRVEVYEWIYDGLYGIKKNASGLLFCPYCQGPYPCLYNNKVEFFNLHSFEPFLAWVNEKITPGNQIVFYEYEDGGTEARIVGPHVQTNQAHRKTIFSYTINFVKK